MPFASPSLQVLAWSGATIAAYVLAKRVHRRFPLPLTSPLLLAPLVIIALGSLTRVEYHDYFRATHWLGLMLGPAMVSFAVPIYERRAIVARHWVALAAGVGAGSALAVGTAWLLSSAMGLSDPIRLSLLARSISTPFAVVVSRDIGGIPELTALFVILTGLIGASIGRLVLYWLPLRSTIARGALFGMGAHSVGVARASRLCGEEGAVAGLVMIFAGLSNVMLAPVLLYVMG